MLKAKLPPRIGQATSSDTSRYAISGVAIRSTSRPGEGWACATDGRRLAVVPIEVEGDSKGWQICPNEVARQQKAVQVELAGTKWKGDLTTEAEIKKGKPRKLVEADAMDASFPPVADVMEPDSEERTSITLNIKLLHELAKAINGDCKEYPDVVRLSIGDPKRPVIVHGNIGIGLIMPVVGRREDSVDAYNRIRDKFLGDMGVPAKKIKQRRPKKQEAEAEEDAPSRPVYVTVPKTAIRDAVLTRGSFWFMPIKGEPGNPLSVDAVRSTDIILSDPTDPEAKPTIWTPARTKFEVIADDSVVTAVRITTPDGNKIELLRAKAPAAATPAAAPPLASDPDPAFAQALADMGISIEDTLAALAA